MAKKDKKCNESDDSNKTTFIEIFSKAIGVLITMISDLKDPHKVKVLENIKAEFEFIVEEANKSSGPINEAQLYESVSSNVEGEKKWPSIKDEVKNKEVKEMFGKDESDKVKAYNPNKCEDAIVHPLLKLRFFKANGVFPTNNQLPLYFCKQVFAEVRKQMSVDYMSTPPGTGHGKKRHIVKKPEKKKRRMDPENLEVPHDLARMSKNDLLQHSIHLTEELRSIISKFNIPLENVSSYVKSYMEKPVTHQDPPFPFDTEASHHCLRRDSEQVENHGLDQDRLTPTGSCGGNQDTQFPFGSGGVNSTARAEACHPQLPKDLEKRVTLLDCLLTDANGQQHGPGFGSPIETEWLELLESIFDVDYSGQEKNDFMDFDHARDRTDYSGPPDDDSQKVLETQKDSPLGFGAPIQIESSESISAGLDFSGQEEIDSMGFDRARTATTDSPRELSPILDWTILDDEQDNSSNASSLTLYINWYLIEAFTGTINVKVLFGPNAILVDCNGRQLPMNEEGFIWQDLQQGAVYYAIPADSYKRPLVGENEITLLALQQAATM